MKSSNKHDYPSQPTQDASLKEINKSVTHKLNEIPLNVPSSKLLNHDALTYHPCSQPSKNTNLFQSSKNKSQIPILCFKSPFNAENRLKHPNTPFKVKNEIYLPDPSPNNKITNKSLEKGYVKIKNYKQFIESSLYPIGDGPAPNTLFITNPESSDKILGCPGKCEIKKRLKINSLSLSKNDYFNRDSLSKTVGEKDDPEIEYQVIPTIENPKNNCSDEINKKTVKMNNLGSFRQQHFPYHHLLLNKINFELNSLNAKLTRFPQKPHLFSENKYHFVLNNNVSEYKQEQAQFFPTWDGNRSLSAFYSKDKVTRKSTRLGKNEVISSNLFPFYSDIKNTYVFSSTFLPLIRNTHNKNEPQLTRLNIALQNLRIGIYMLNSETNYIKFHNYQGSTLLSEIYTLQNNCYIKRSPSLLNLFFAYRNLETSAISLTGNSPGLSKQDLNSAKHNHRKLLHGSDLSNYYDRNNTIVEHYLNSGSKNMEHPNKINFLCKDNFGKERKTEIKSEKIEEPQINTNLNFSQISANNQMQHDYLEKNKLSFGEPYIHGIEQGEEDEPMMKRLHTQQQGPFEPSLDLKSHATSNLVIGRNASNLTNTLKSNNISSLVEAPTGKKSMVCKFCAESFRSFLNLEKHLSTIHKLQISRIEVYLKGYDKLSSWKSANLEIETQTFIEYGKSKLKNGEVIYYRCNYKLNGNYGCCAHYIVRSFNNGRIKIRGVSTHNHRPNWDQIKLTKEKKLAFIDMIRANKSVEDIHKDILKSIKNDFIDKKSQTVNINYLKYLKKKYGATFQENDNDFKSFIILKTKFIKAAQCIEIYYKPTGIHDNDIPKNDNDFVFAFTSKSMMSAFENFGSEVISIDSTHSTNIYGYKLIVGLILNEMHQGFPIFYIISSTEKEVVLTKCFSNLKKILRNNINPKFIMTDMYMGFYNAWRTVFGDDSQQLWCCFHVMAAWKKNLNCLVKDAKDRNLIWKQLNHMITVADVDHFLRFKSRFETLLKTKNKAFHDYFVKVYGTTAEKWALCYRKKSSLNVNNVVEAHFKVLKYKYLKRNVRCRIDFLFHKILEMVDEKWKSNIVKLASNKKNDASAKMKESYNGHKKSEDLDAELFDTTDLNKIKYKSYYITNNHFANCDSKRKSLCPYCEICYDCFSCTCLQYLRKKYLCKHIHKVVSMFYRKSDNPQNQDEIFAGPYDSSEGTDDSVVECPVPVRFTKTVINVSQETNFKKLIARNLEEIKSLTDQFDEDDEKLREISSHLVLMKDSLYSGMHDAQIRAEKMKNQNRVKTLPQRLTRFIKVPEKGSERNFVVVRKKAGRKRKIKTDYDRNDGESCIWCGIHESEESDNDVEGWIECEKCLTWQHIVCVKINLGNLFNSMDDFVCC